jgi:hypothetical protein
MKTINILSVVLTFLCFHVKVTAQQQQALYVQESSIFGAQEMFLTASKVQIKGSDTYTVGSIWTTQAHTICS